MSKNNSEERYKLIAPEEVILGAMGAYEALAKASSIEGRGKFSKIQANIIFGLSFEGALSIGEIAKHHGASKEHVTRVVSELERDGIVSKQRNENNFREVIATLTEHGRQIALGMRRECIDALEANLSDLSKSDRRALIKASEEALNILDKIQC